MLDPDGKKVRVKAGTEQRLINEHGYSPVDSKKPKNEPEEKIAETEPDNSVEE